MYVLSIISKNMQQDVEVHTYSKQPGRSPGAQNINGEIIKGI